MTLRGNSNKSSTSKDSSASSSGTASLASAFSRGDGQRHGSTESTDTVRGIGGQRMRVNTANKKLAQYVHLFPLVISQVAGWERRDVQ